MAGLSTAIYAFARHRSSSAVVEFEPERHGDLISRASASSVELRRLPPADAMVTKKLEMTRNEVLPFPNQLRANAPASESKLNERIEMKNKTGGILLCTAAPN